MPGPRARVRAAGDGLQRQDQIRAAGPHQLARHAPDHRRLLRLGDGAPPRGAQRGHGGGAVIAHSGHQNADQLLRWQVGHGARDEAVDAGMPAMLGAGRRRQHDRPAGAQADDHVGIATGDMHHAGRERHRPRDLHHLQRAEPVQPAGQRGGEGGRHVLRHDDRPGKVAGSCVSTASSAGGPPVEVPMSTRPGTSLLSRDARPAASARWRAAGPGRASLGAARAQALGQPVRPPDA
jgi:hypothetical protein